jgi:hypothetical protein
MSPMGEIPQGKGPHTGMRPRAVLLRSRRPRWRRNDQEDELSRKSAKNAAGEPDKARSAIDGGRPRQHSIDAEPARYPVFEAIGRGLLTLGQKVRTRGFDAGRI